MNKTETAAVFDIDHTASAYAAARLTLADRITHLQTEMDTITRRLLPGIKKAAADAATLKAALVEYVALNPGLFKEPKTMTLYGVKFGFQKGKGRIVWADSEALAKKIKEQLPRRFAELVKVTHKPRAKQLATLSVDELKKLGCTVIAAGNEIIVTDAADNVDKLVAKFLGEGAQPSEAEES